MDDLIEFLRARYAEEKAEAEKQSDEGRYDIDPWEIRKDTEANYPCADFLRIAKARVLAEVEVKRKIIGMYESAAIALRNSEPDTPIRELMTGSANSYLFALRAHATAYVDHPDYDERWRL